MRVLILMLIGVGTILTTSAQEELTFHFVNPTRSGGNISDMMDYVVEAQDRKYGDEGDLSHMYYFITGLQTKCSGFGMEDCKRCGLEASSRPASARDMRYHWEYASSLFNELDFLNENGAWKVGQMNWHFYYGGDEIADGVETEIFIDPFLRICGTNAADPRNQITFHVPEEHENASIAALKRNALFNHPHVQVKSY